MQYHPLVFIALVIISASAADNLKWIGAWRVSNPVETAYWTNLLFDTDDLSIIKTAHSHNISVLYQTMEIFLTGSETGLQLKSTYKQDWDKMVPALSELLEKNIIFGFFLGDELCWNGLSFSNLTTIADLVRKTFPRATIFYNEAYPVFVSDVNIYHKKIGYSKVPDSINWISLDIYPDLGDFNKVKEIYEQNFYPKLSASQSALYVPPSYSTEGDQQKRICGGDCAVQMALWAQFSYEWAQTQDKIIGLLPWHWDSLEPKTQPYFVGLKELEVAKYLWTVFGKAIKK